MSFAIYTHNTDDGLVLDVPGSNTEEGTQIVLYGDFNGGPNQLWTQVAIENKCEVQEYQIVSSLKETMCLGVATEHSTTRENLPAVICDRKNPNYHNVWMLEPQDKHTILKLRDFPDFVLTNNMDDNIVISSRIKDEQSQCDDAQLWFINTEPKMSDAKPATSCHFTYGPHLNLTKDVYQKVMKKHGWTLRNTVRVKEVTDCTYFCIVGWGPGGYSGIQQINENRRVALFSMWHDSKDKNSKVECLSFGDDVEVESFGGEGCGVKAMKDFWWNVGEEITFIVKGIYEEAYGGWSCSCYYKRSSEENGKLHFMATYRRQGEGCPLSDSGFYSFVEDWDRGNNAEGYLVRRCAVFTSPEIEYGGQCDILEGGKCENDGGSVPDCIKTVKLLNPSFTKVETGCDAFAKNTANAKIKPGKCKFTLETGGCPKYTKEL